MAYLTAGNITLQPKLRDPLAAIAQKRQMSLQDALGRIGGRETTSGAVSGRPTGEYIGQTLGQAGQMASRGIEDSLYNVLGGASLKDTLAQKEHEQNIALAKRIGALNKPNLFSEILGGIGQLGGTALSLKGLFPSGGSSAVKGSLPPNLSLLQGLGPGRYGI